MRQLATIEHAPNLLQQVAQGVPCSYRTAIKAVLWRGNKLLLLYSPKWNCYKFAGGGVEANESHADTLRRELREEAGAEMLQAGPCLLKVTELALLPEAASSAATSLVSTPNAEIFQMVSYYYICHVAEAQQPPKLEPYEVELGLTPVWVTPEVAVEANVLATQREGAPRWLRREVAVLRAL